MEYGWDFITERIALGGAFESPADADALKAAGITHVINCTEICDPLYVEQQFTMCWPMPRRPDDGAPRGAAWFTEGLKFWIPVSLYPLEKVYVHCHAGMNRSASMVYAILRSMGIKPSDARHLIAVNRPLDIAGDFGGSLLGIRYADEADAALKG